jgi:hypothetical protein
MSPHDRIKFARIIFAIAPSATAAGLAAGATKIEAKAATP